VGPPAASNALAPGLADAVVLATNSARLKNGVEVSSGDVMVNAASPGPTLHAGYELAIEPQVTTAAASRLSGDSVRVKSKAVIGGDVSYNQLTNQGTIQGALLTPLALPVFSSLPPVLGQAPAAGATDVMVPAGGSAFLVAGEHGAVTVGAMATLTFDGGDFSLLSLTAGDGARLLFGGPARVHVAGRVLTGSDVVVGPDVGSSAGPADLAFFVTGIDGTTGTLGSTPRATELGPRNLVGASFWVPGGTLRLGQRSDATGAFLARDVLIENQSRLALASFFFNRAPEAEADEASVAEGGTVTLLDSGAASVLANDSDLFGDPLTATLVSGPSHGSLTLNADGTFSYQHDGSETTSDAFEYQACDDAAPSLCDTATVSLTIDPVNDPPLAADDAIAVQQGGTATQLVGGATSLLANDSDPDSSVLAVTVTPVSGPSHGSLLLAADGNFSYAHDGSETSSDGFVYEVCDDGSPVECATATVSIAISDSAEVAVVLTGTGSGRVTSSPAGIDCGDTCTASFPGGPVTLTPEAAPGSAFFGFSGDADCTDGSLAAGADTTCVARFDLVAVTATLTVSLAGTGSGSVLSDPAGVACPGDCAADYAVPTRVELFATADPGSTLVGWTGDADCLDGFVEVRGAIGCTAVFDLLPPPPASFTLHLDFLGGGIATVTSNPAGVLCEEDCSVSIPQGQTLVLFVRPMEGTFVAWGGDCAGSDVSTTVTMNADKTCTVTVDP
jgi:VCBS repeat-containing protein